FPISRPSSNLPGPKGPGARSRGAGCKLHTCDVEAGVDHQDLAGNALRGVTQKERGRLAYFARLDVAPQRRTIAVDAENAREPADAHRGNRLDGTGRDGVDADI